MDLEELTMRTGMPARQIRYLISLGVVPRAKGSRTKPEYGDEHLDAIKLSMSMKASGVKANALPAIDAGSHVAFAPMPGVVLTVPASHLPRNYDRAALAAQFSSIFAEHLSHLIKEPK